MQEKRKGCRKNLGKQNNRTCSFHLKEGQENSRCLWISRKSTRYFPYALVIEVVHISDHQIRREKGFSHNITSFCKAVVEKWEPRLEN